MTPRGGGSVVPDTPAHPAGTSPAGAVRPPGTIGPPPDGSPTAGKLLAGITSPADVRALPPQDLPALAEQVRAELVATVTRTGGHLGPNLGAVELTIAVHRVFDSPRDAVLWDTGHQAYVHKMLTGRTAALAGLRQAGGMSGYPCRAESPHDLVENSHASTALSYAAGLAGAFALRGEDDRCVVAVVGDGALTGGMAWEALNNLGAAGDRRVVVVLNDNGRSYDPTVGGLAAHLAALRSGAPGPAVTEQLGLAYLGPVDGHDVAALETALRAARDLRTPALVHCLTEKGRGYAPALADDADRMHAVSPAPPPTASGAGRAVAAARPPSWTAVLAEELRAVGCERPDVVALTAAMARPTGVHALSVERPAQVQDVGIAEQHAVTSAAGLAMGGMHPVVALYATFLNRAFDQVLMDVGLHRLPVTFVLDRAGVTGNDGASHHGLWDLALLGMVPGMRVAAPRDAATLRALLREAVADGSGPTALRFAKGTAGRDLPALRHRAGLDVLVEPGAGEAAGAPDVLLVGVGAMAAVAVDAAVGLSGHGVPALVVDPRWVLPVPDALVDLARGPRLVVTLEDGAVSGGVGDAVCRALRGAGVRTDVQTLGLPQEYLPHGERADLLAAAGLDATGVLATVLEALEALEGGADTEAGRPVVGARGSGQEKRRASAR